MRDPFSGFPTCIRGRALPSAAERSALQDDHERRLAALARLSAAAAECGIRADTDRDLVLLAEDELILLEGAGGPWAALGQAIHAWRACLPILPLDAFGFPAGHENAIEEANPALHRIGAGVEAWAFASVADGSVYKFYLPREDKRIGSAFSFRRGDEATLAAEAHLGDYRGLLEKLLIVHLLGRLATEVVGVTPEGILVAKQTYGEPLAQGADVSGVLPTGLIEIPSRFLRANRDHPRLMFVSGQPFLVGDLHARNLVRAADGALHPIDLVAAPWPLELSDAMISDWLTRVQENPSATLLASGHDDEL